MSIGYENGTHSIMPFDSAKLEQEAARPDFVSALLAARAIEEHLAEMGGVDRQGLSTRQNCDNERQKICGRKSRKSHPGT